jgi:hypothetical protein
MGGTPFSGTTSWDIQTVQSGLGAFISSQLTGEAQGLR